MQLVEVSMDANRGAVMRDGARLSEAEEKNRQLSE